MLLASGDFSVAEIKMTSRSFFSNGVQRGFRRWIDRRVPPARKVTLNHKQIFIFPTRVGFSFFIVLLTMLLAGVNYENSLIFAVTFLLVSISIASILYTFNNLSDLTVTAVEAKPCFAGEYAGFEIMLSNDNGKPFENIVFKWQRSTPVTEDLILDRERHVTLYLKTEARGLMRPDRLLIETYYPVGLLRAWTWLDLDMSVIVYPKPIPGGEVTAVSISEHDGALLDVHGAEDFAGLIDYYPGASLNHVAWKSFARGQGMYLKNFSGYVDRRIWLEWDQFTGIDREIRLSRLCYCVLEVDRSNDEYGLRLPGLEIQPNKGAVHRSQVLKALALLGVEE